MSRDTHSIREQALDAADSTELGELLQPLPYVVHGEHLDERSIYPYPWIITLEAGATREDAEHLLEVASRAGYRAIDATPERGSITLRSYPADVEQHMVRCDYCQYWVREVNVPSHRDPHPAELGELEVNSRGDLWGCCPEHLSMAERERASTIRGFLEHLEEQSEEHSDA